MASTRRTVYGTYSRGPASHPPSSAVPAPTRAPIRARRSSVSSLIGEAGFPGGSGTSLASRSAQPAGLVVVDRRARASRSRATAIRRHGPWTRLGSSAAGCSPRAISASSADARSSWPASVRSWTRLNDAAGLGQGRGHDALHQLRRSSEVAGTPMRDDRGAVVGEARLDLERLEEVDQELGVLRAARPPARDGRARRGTRRAARAARARPSDAASSRPARARRSRAA